jgi:TIR domain
MPRTDLLFWKSDLRSTLEQDAHKARDAIASLSASQIAGEAGNSFIAELEKEYRVAPLKLLEEGIAIEQEEIKVDVSHDPMRSVFDRSRPCYIPGQRVRYIVPFEGDSKLWECRPSTFNSNPPRAQIEGTELVFQFEVPNDEVSRTKQYFDSELSNVKQWIQYSAVDVESHNQHLGQVLRDALARRREQLGQTAEQIQSLELPVRRRSSTPQADATPSRERSAPRRSRAPAKDYDVALSFAGEDRDYVEKVAALLQASGIKVFYDKFETVQLWGRNLADHLGEIYGKRSRFVMMFISKHYPHKGWPTHERQSAQARAIRENKIVLLPARFDDTEIPGLPSTTGYIDLRQSSPEQLAELIKQKLSE